MIPARPHRIDDRTTAILVRIQTRVDAIDDAINRKMWRWKTALGVVIDARRLDRATSHDGALATQHALDAAVAAALRWLAEPPADPTGCIGPHGYGVLVGALEVRLIPRGWTLLVKPELPASAATGGATRLLDTIDGTTVARVLDAAGPLIGDNLDFRLDRDGRGRVTGVRVPIPDRLVSPEADRARDAYIPFQSTVYLPGPWADRRL